MDSRMPRAYVLVPIMSLRLSREQKSIPELPTDLNTPLLNPRRWPGTISSATISTSCWFPQAVDWRPNTWSR